MKSPRTRASETVDELITLRSDGSAALLARGRAAAAQLRAAGRAQTHGKGAVVIRLHAAVNKVKRRRVEHAHGHMVQCELALRHDQPTSDPQPLASLLQHTARLL